MLRENEIIKQMSQIEPCLLEDETDVETATKFCVSVLTVLTKCKGMKFSDEKRRELCRAMSDIGCVPYNKANECLRAKEETSIEETLFKDNNVEFPLMAFSQLLSTTGFGFDYSLAKLNNGYIDTWLKTQQPEQVEENQMQM